MMLLPISVIQSPSTVVQHVLLRVLIGVTYLTTFVSALAVALVQRGLSGAREEWAHFIGNDND